MNPVATMGDATVNRLAGFGDFCRFSGRTLAYSLTGAGQPRMYRLLLMQMFEVGVRSVPVIMATGVFVGMVLAAQSVLQFQAAGLEARLGSIINLSVVRELGPVLAVVMLTGRVGGALSAELGTMRVTEQIDALRAMGADPVRVLVAPRFVACVLLAPVLVLYANATGILGGYAIGVWVYQINSADFWRHAANTVQMFDILSGLFKSILFAGSMALICCYRGFRCRSGAAGVGRACRESFVETCLTILVLDFFAGMVQNTVYVMTWGRSAPV